MADTEAKPDALPKGVAAVMGERVWVGPDAALHDVLLARPGGTSSSCYCRGVISCLEEPSEEDQAAQQLMSTPGTGVRFLHIPLQDTADQQLRDAIAGAVDFITSVLEEDADAAADGDAAGQQADDDDEDDGGVGEESAAAAAPTGAPPATDAAEAQRSEATPTRRRSGVYVHCQAGKSRSVALVLGYLIVARQRTLSEALEQVGRENAAPNPGFVLQLVELEREVHGDSTFDVTAFFVSNLVRLFPKATESDARGALQRANGDVYAARTALMRQHAAALVDRDAVMVDCLVKAVEAQCIPRRIVQQVYDESGKSRDKALMRLINMQPEELVALMNPEDTAAAAAGAGDADAAAAEDLDAVMARFRPPPGAVSE